MSTNEQPVFQIRLRSQRVQREMDGLLGADYKRVATKLKALANNPRPQGCEKLSGDIYRVRVGNIRIIYIIDKGNNRIEVGGIRHRGKSTYKGIDDLFG